MARKTKGSDGIADPTISDVLDHFLDEQRARLSTRTYNRYESVIDLLMTSLDHYGYNTLDEDESRLFERLRDSAGDDELDFCDIFGPEHILPNVDEFLGYFMVRKVIAGKGLLRAAGTVTKKLAKWLEANGYADSEDAADAVEQGASAARDLPAVEELVDLLNEYAAEGLAGNAADVIEDRFEIRRVEPGKIWLEGLVESGTIGPIKIPREMTGLCKVGWWISGEVGRFGRSWKIIEVWNVYPRR